MRDDLWSMLVALALASVAVATVAQPAAVALPAAAGLPSAAGAPEATPSFPPEARAAAAVEHPA